MLKKIKMLFNLFNFLQVVFYVFSPALVGGNLARTVTLESFLSM